MEKRLRAVIVNCMYAPMLEEPDKDSCHLCDISCLSNVYIVEAGNDRYYKVILHDGTTGYCEKRFLAIKKES